MKREAKTRLFRPPYEALLRSWGSLLRDYSAVANRQGLNKRRGVGVKWAKMV